jgi:hypothetical protein
VKPNRHRISKEGKVRKPTSTLNSGLGTGLSSVAVRRLVEGRIGKIRDAVWKFAVEERMVSQYMEELDLDWLVGKINILEGLAGEQSHRCIDVSRRQRRTKRLPSRQEAFSCYVAKAARADLRVKQFRKAYFSGRLLTREELEPWISQQSKEHPYRHAVIVRLPAGTTPECHEDGSYTLNPPLTEITCFEAVAPIRFLDYPRTGREWVQRIPVGPDGPLGELYKISESLAEAYGWQRAQATAFVLTDLAPEITPCTVSFAGRDFGGLARIQLVVDPYYTPAEVAQMYKPIRSRVWKGKAKGLSEKHTRLGIHVLHHPDFDHGCMQKWNEQYPNWAFSDMKRFKREASMAHSRLNARVRGWTTSPLKLVGIDN